VCPGSAKGGSLETHTDSSRQQPSLKTERWQGRSAEGMEALYLALSELTCGGLPKTKAAFGRPLFLNLQQGFSRFIPANTTIANSCLSKGLLPLQ
jgi:hypothetical protein